MKNLFIRSLKRKQIQKAEKLWFYAEDAGLDLPNEIALPYTADKAYEIDYYINKFAEDSGFEIGLNEVSGTKKLA